MDDRTREYLRGRFGDYYRSVSLTPPPDANEREWGHIPWTTGSGTTMIRHQSMYDLGNLDTFFAETAPRHAYFSAARYDDPGASTMGKKGWRSADLVFDLDADHLPGIDPAAVTYAEMLETCKDALYRLLEFLEEDFAFEDLEIVFSGGRGYHVHVRDEDVLELGSEARREVVDYVRAIDLEIDHVVREETVAGSFGRKTPARNRRLPEGGWGGRLRRELQEYGARLQEATEEEAIEELTELDRVGPKTAKGIRNVIENNPEALAEGNLSAHAGLSTLAKRLLPMVRDTYSSPIDEPVTTDTRRLIRFPGTLHGGSGLRVTRIDRDELDAFDPLVDAIPERFVGREIAVECDESGEFVLNGDTFKVDEGNNTLQEYAGVFLMARGDARKIPER